MVRRLSVADEGTDKAATGSAAVTAAITVQTVVDFLAARVPKGLIGVAALVALLVDGPYEISAGPGGAVRQMWTTITLTRAADAWRIAAIRNMVPTSPGASGRP